MKYQRLHTEIKRLIDYVQAHPFMEDREIDDKISEMIMTHGIYEELTSIGELYTPAEVAEYLKIAEKTVKDFLRNGRLKGVKVGKEWRIKASALKDYVEGLDER